MATETGQHQLQLQQPRDGEGDLPDARLLEALAIAIVMRHPLGALLVEADADLPGDLGLDELADEPGERLTQDVGVLIV